MANTKFRKVLSIVLAIAMVASMFVCMSTISASALVDVNEGPTNDDPNEKMAAQALKDSDRCAVTSYDYTWFSLTYYDEFNLEAGQEYMFTYDIVFFETDAMKASSDPFELCDDFRIWLTDTSGKNDENVIDTSTGEMNTNRVTDVYSSPKATDYGFYRKVIRFTPKDDVPIAYLQIGNTSSGTSGAFYLGRPGLYKCNSDHEALAGNMVRDMLSGGGWIRYSAKNTSVNLAHWTQGYGVWNMRAAGGPSGAYKNPNATNAYEPFDSCDGWQSQTKTVMEYFDAPLQLKTTGPENPFDQGAYYQQGTANTLRFGKDTVATYNNNNREIIIDKTYELAFEGNFTGENIVATVNVAGEDQEVEVEYDETLGYYTGSFMATAATVSKDDTANLQVIIGTGADTTALIAKPCLYLLDDESGNRQGANLIHDFASNNFSDTADENYKWVITGTTRSYEYSALKPSDGIAKKIVNLKNGSASSLAYTDSVSLAAGDYRFVMGCRRYYLDELDVTIEADDTAVTGTAVYDDTNRTLTYDFTLASAASKIDISIAGDDTTLVAVGKPALYALDAGEISGNSLIADIDALTLVTADAVNGEWLVSGNYSTANLTDIFFNPNGGCEDIMVFPGGHENHWGYMSFRDYGLVLRAVNFYLVADVVSSNPNYDTLQAKFTFQHPSKGMMDYGLESVAAENIPACIDGVGPNTKVLTTRIFGDYGSVTLLMGLSSGADTTTLAAKNVRLVAVSTTGELISNNLLEPLNGQTFVGFKANGDSKYGKYGNADVERRWFAVNIKKTDFQNYENTAENDAFFFPTSNAAKLTNLINEILGKTSFGNIYAVTDVNKDGAVDILDLVKAKKDIADAVAAEASAS